eukprot:SAG11_NODE_4_length_33019_cov_28.098909_22_plen_226_part_00
MWQYLIKPMKLEAAWSNIATHVAELYELRVTALPANMIAASPEQWSSKAKAIVPVYYSDVISSTLALDPFWYRGHGDDLVNSELIEMGATLLGYADGDPAQLQNFIFQPIHLPTNEWMRPLTEIVKINGGRSTSFAAFTNAVDSGPMIAALQSAIIDQDLSLRQELGNVPVRRGDLPTALDYAAAQIVHMHMMLLDHHRLKASLQDLYGANFARLMVGCTTMAHT